MWSTRKGAPALLVGSDEESFGVGEMDEIRTTCQTEFGRCKWVVEGGSGQTGELLR